MTVVSDTSPLRYLPTLGGLEWLNHLFGEIVCPPEVMAECQHENAPDALRTWALAPPPWLRITHLSDNARPLPTGIS